MPFTTSISLTQGADCSQFTVTDTSTYNVEATGTFSARKLTILKSDGTYLKVNGITYNQYVNSLNNRESQKNELIKIKQDIDEIKSLLREIVNGSK